MQKEIILLSNLFSNRLDNFVNSFDKENIICYCQTKKVTSSWLLDIKKNRVVNYFKIKKKALEKNRIIGYSKIEEKAIDKNKITSQFKIEEKIKSANEDISKISFFY